MVRISDFNTEVQDHEPDRQRVWEIADQSEGVCRERTCMVNAAGVYADVFHNMVSEK